MKDIKSTADQVCEYTASKLAYYSSISQTGPGRGLLAELRRGAGKKPGELPELWGVIFDCIPERLEGKDGASYAEWAVYTALTLYALHRQGSDGDVNAKGVSVGKAAAGLVTSDDDIGRVTNRLGPIMTAASPEDAAYHLRGLIQLLKSEGIMLDYAALAKDLYLFNISDHSDSVKLRWGRDFYREINNRFNKSKGEDNNG